MNYVYASFEARLREEFARFVRLLQHFAMLDGDDE